MGIYDRDYVRDRRGGGGTLRGPGRSVGVLGMFSVNTWIIVANVLVFALAAATSRTGVPVLIAQELGEGLGPDARIAESSEYFRPATISISPDRPLQALQRDRHTGQPIAVPTRDIVPGDLLVRVLVDTDRNTPAGYTLYRAMDPLHAYGHFSTALAFFRVEVWRFVTFQFLHANIAHLFFNMFGLFIFGGLVEQQLGRKRYAAFYLVCGVFGGISYLILNVLGAGLGLRLPGVLIGDIHTPLVGASAGVFGVIMACARIAPNAVVQLIFPPIPLRMKWLAYGYVGLAVFNLLRAGQNAGGDAAHVGGAIAGWFFIRNSHLLRDFFDIFGDSRKGPRRPRAAGPSQRDIDRILRKVGDKGMDSLSEKEKRMLARASEAERRRG